MPTDEKSEKHDANIRTLIPTINPGKYLKEREETLKLFIVGSKDLNGSLIKKIYARGDEYIIYEIEDSIGVDSLKVLIYTKVEEDNEPIINFQKVKDNFDKLKSILYRSGSDASYRHRAASAIVKAIHGDVSASNALLQSIEADAQEDYKHKTYGRLVYLLGAFLITVLCVLIGFIGYINRETPFMSNNPDFTFVLYSISFAVLGGFLSVSLKAKEVFHQRAIDYWMYAIYGAERLLASIIAGVATYIFVASGLILSTFNNNENGIYVLMVISFISGFSEKFIPNSLNKIENQVERKTNKQINKD